MWCATMVFALNAESTFEKVDLTTDYRKPPFDGDMTRLLKRPVGWAGGCLECAALLLFIIFKIWAGLEVGSVSSTGPTFNLIVLGIRVWASDAAI